MEIIIIIIILCIICLIFGFSLTSLRHSLQRKIYEESVSPNDKQTLYYISRQNVSHIRSSEM